MRRTHWIGSAALVWGCLLMVAGSSEGSDRWAREHERHQTELLRQQREQQLDSVRYSTKQSEESLRHWYETERAGLRSEYSHARQHLRGRVWSEYVRGYSSRYGDLARQYSHQRRDLTRHKIAAERNTRDQYRQFERGLQHQPAYGCGHSAAVVGRPLLYGVPTYHTSPTLQLSLPRFGLTIH